MTDAIDLVRAWELATVPLLNPAYATAVREFLNREGAISTQRLRMFELAVEIRWMRGTYKDLRNAWMPHDAPRHRAATIPGSRRAQESRKMMPTDEEYSCL
jgi:hypothetical protein